MTTVFFKAHHSTVHLYTYLALLDDDDESANSSPSKDSPEAEAGPVLGGCVGGARVRGWRRGWVCVHHK